MNNIDTGILNYLKDFKPEKLDTLITSPYLIKDSIFLADGHQLKEEAIIIIDSLGSYNNRMHNDDREEDLISISEDSPLFSWRCGVLAIKEFYEENHIKVTEYLNDIRIESPVKKLSVFLNKSKPTSLIDEDKNLTHSIDALKEVISHKMLDIYPNCIKLILDDLKIEQNIKENIILTIIEESTENIPLEIIHKSIGNFSSIAESTRLMALGTLFKYPIKSIQYLFSYFTLNNYKTTEDINLNALITIILDIVKLLIKDGYKFNDSTEKENFRIDCELFINELRQYYQLDFKKSENPLTNLKRALDIKFNNKSQINNQNEVLQGKLF